MAYRLRALIGSRASLESIGRKSPSGRLVELAQGLHLLHLAGETGAGPFPGLDLSGRLAGWASEASGSGPIAYVEADYGPGRNFQAGVAWSSGRVLAGPLCDRAAWDPREPSMKERPVNVALRALGVVAEGYSDEWDAVALNRHNEV